MDETQAPSKESEKKTLLSDLLFLLLKIGIFVLLLAGLFLFVFGICRCSGHSMSPACKDGDLAFYYRLQSEYRPSDVIVLEQDGETQIRRIIAAEGDVVDITEDGLKINGYLQQEPEIYTETLPYVDGISFPITVGPDEYFVLGDNRSQAEDSRVYGTVNHEDVKGLVITLLRRRGI